MSQCDYAVTHADKFVDDLQKQLNLLDGANIQSIMASEESVLKLMDMLGNAISHVEMLETQLDGYDDILDQVCLIFSYGRVKMKSYIKTRQKGLQNNSGPMLTLLYLAFIAIACPRSKRSPAENSYSGELLTL